MFGKNNSLRSKESIRGVGTIAKFRIFTPSLSLNEISRRSIVNRSLVISKGLYPAGESSEVALACGTISPGRRDVQGKQLEQNPGRSHVESNEMEGSKFDAEPQGNPEILAGSRGRFPEVFVPESKTPPGPGLLNFFPDKNVDNSGLHPNSDRLLMNPNEEERDLAGDIKGNYGSEFSMCYGGDLGCLETDKTWYDLNPHDVDQPPENHMKSLTFYLNTRGTCFNDKILDPFNVTTIQDSRFNSSHQTKFIVHGFLNSGNDRWVKKMVKGLLSAGDFNVIVVDWMYYALSLYTQATEDTRVVGQQIANLVRMLAETKGLKHEDVHIIGHSLGAHIAGYAGEIFTAAGTKLGRITGLDPAGPLFNYLPENKRLDPPDAKFVEALHTNALDLYRRGYGITVPVGHVDFFPNGGESQPGCERISLPSIEDIKLNNWTLGDIFACDHNRATSLYTDAITSGKIIGYECENYNEFLQANCTSCRPDDQSCTAAEFGLNGSAEAAVQGRQKVKMYFKTSSSSPYALTHYKMTVYTDDSKTTDIVEGIMEMTVIGILNEAKREQHLGRHAITIKHGMNLTFLLTSPMDVGNVTKVHLHLKQSVGAVFSGGPIYVKSVQIGQMTLSDPEARRAMTFYPCEGTEIAPDEMKAFTSTPCNI